MKEKRPATPLARRLKETAQEAGLTAEVIAEELGISGPAVRHWWSARSEPSYASLQAYARVVGRSAYYLLTGEDDPAELYSSVQQILREFDERLAEGAASVAALAAAGGDLEALSETERLRLNEVGPSLREYLAGGGGAAWLVLSDEERDLVLRLVWNLARRRQPHRDDKAR